MDAHKHSKNRKKQRSNKTTHTNNEPLERPQIFKIVKRPTAKRSEPNTSSVDHKTHVLAPANYSPPSGSKILHNHQQSVQQSGSTPKKFSSRNSLRSAQVDSNDNCQQPLSDPSTEIMIPDKIDAFMASIGVKSADNYEPLSHGDCFVRDIGSFYYCCLCGKRSRILPGSSLDEHIQSRLHLEALFQLRSLLVNQTPEQDSLQIRAATELLTRWYNNNVLTDIEVDLRNNIAEEFDAFLQTINPQCTSRMIGSLPTGTSLKKSNINLELVHPNSRLFEADIRSKNSPHHELVDPDAEYGNQINKHTLHYDLIANAIDTLHKTAITINSGYSSVSNSFTVISGLDDLSTKAPRLILKHIPTQLSLEITCGAESMFKLTNLLSAYLSLDERAKQLSILVKYWASLCNISRPEEGTYSPDTFIILVIFFLQRTTPPVLPCLHEILSKNSKEDHKAQTKGEISNEFLEKFNKHLSLESQEDNPSSSNVNLRNNGLGVVDNVDNDLEQVIDSGEADDDADNDDNNEESSDIIPDMEVVKSLNWISTNDTTTCRLFIDFLGSMMREFHDISTVISIRTLKKMPLIQKSWSTQVKGIENPVTPSLNISRSIGAYRTFEYIARCFKNSYFYLTSIPLNLQLKPINEPQVDASDYINLYVERNRLDFYFNMKEKAIKAAKSEPAKIVREMVQQRLFARDVDVIESLIVRYIEDGSDLDNLPATVANFYSKHLLAPQDHAATSFCWLCRRTGHIRKMCPKGKIDNLSRELDKYNPDYDLKMSLDRMFLSCYRDDSIAPRISQQHSLVVKDLTRIIKKATKLDCKLQLFGSTVNGLGCCDSDLDICMTLEGNSTGKGVNCVEILQKVHRVLEKHGKIYKIEPILSARVPILRFRYDDFDVDLSMYNQCAVYNSELLKAYVSIDHRVAPLSYLVKRYAKACWIADASRGSLSSYAWSLMVIHFLQQIGPPILPVLQETDGKKPTIGVNGWNVWFNRDIGSIRMPANEATITQLFKQFLLYYGTFDFNQYVISIRTRRLLSKFQKNWIGCKIAIEDPFELTFNLSSRLDDPMAIFIINSFARAYKKIVKVQESFRGQNGRIPDYVESWIFNGMNIMGSEPPYRGCRNCHRIGHRLKDCPEPKESPITRNNRLLGIIDDDRIKT